MKCRPAEDQLHLLCSIRNPSAKDRAPGELVHEVLTVQYSHHLRVGPLLHNIEVMSCRYLGLDNPPSCGTGCVAQNLGNKSCLLRCNATMNIIPYLMFAHILLVNPTNARSAFYDIHYFELFQDLPHVLLGCFSGTNCILCLDLV